MVDRQNQILTVYDENGKQLAQGKKGANSVELTGLDADTAYRPAQFYVAYVDGSNVSPKVALPAFQTLAKQAPVTSTSQDPSQSQSADLNNAANESNSKSQTATSSDDNQASSASASQSTGDSQSKPVSASQAPSASENSKTGSNDSQAQPASDSKSVSSSSSNDQLQK